MTSTRADSRAQPRSGTLMDVEHIVILMQENRSFDHYFGTMQGVRGFGDRFPIPVAPAAAGLPGSVWFQRNERPDAAPRVVAPFRLNTEQAFGQIRVTGTPHLWPNAQGAWNHGRLDRWPTFKQNHSMAYFTEDDIPFQFALAKLFTVCDAYHCSFQGGTNPNRVFAFTGTNDPLAQGHGPVLGNRYDNLAFDPAGGYAWTTYPERLQAAGVTWQVYQDMADNYTDNPLVGFRTFRDAAAGAQGGPDSALHEQLRARALSTRDLAALRRDVQDDALPQVSFIVATAAGSEHPVPSSPAQGADYTAAVLEALASNPAVWSKTVLLLMFDENDGFFDHAPPPAPPSYIRHDSDPMRSELAGASTVTTLGEYHEFGAVEDHGSAELKHRPYGLGPRVPMYVISPWSRGGWVNSQVFDHTSIIRFIEQRFGVMEPNISPWRRAVCGDLCSAFDFTSHDASAFLAALPATGERAARARQLGATMLPSAPPQPAAPLQTSGVKPSRALPYRLNVKERATEGQALGAGALELVFVNDGAAGAVFHVYDQLNLAAIPRRYTVEAGKELAGRWEFSGLHGAYDLWVLGSNGFHRRFAGHAAETSFGPRPQVRFQAEHGAGTLSATFSATPGSDATFVVTANAYGHRGATLSVAAGATETLTWDLAESGYWYDLSVTVAQTPAYVAVESGGWSPAGSVGRKSIGLGGPLSAMSRRRLLAEDAALLRPTKSFATASFVRRFAGRLETGRDSISDPAMGGLGLVR